MCVCGVGGYTRCADGTSHESIALYVCECGVCTCDISVYGHVVRCVGGCCVCVHVASLCMGTWVGVCVCVCACIWVCACVCTCGISVRVKWCCVCVHVVCVYVCV